jgi:Leucine-rich repeat (LRR) protein
MTSPKLSNPDADDRASTHPKQRWRWLQFSLRTFVILSVLVGTGVGMVTRQVLRANRQREIVERLFADGFQITYEGNVLVTDLSQIRDREVRDYYWRRVDLWNDVERIEGPQLFRTITPDTLKLIAELPELERLDLDGLRKEVAAFPLLACRRRLKHLRIANYPLGPGDAARIAECTSLTSLELRVYEPSNQELGALHNLKQLRSLRIHGPLADDAVALWRHFPYLEELCLSNSSQPSSTLLADLLRRHPTLRRIQLVHFDGAPEVCEALRNCHSLERLDLSQSDVNDERLAILRDLPRLSKLDVGHTKVTGTVFEASGGFQELVELSARGSRFDDEGARRLANLPQLEDLYLSKTRITDAACEHLSRCHLVKLALSNNQLSDRGVAALGGQRLEELYLEGTDVSLGAFATPSDWPRLKVLYLSKRAKDEAEVAQVLQIPTLVRLYASGPIGGKFAREHAARFTLMPSVDPARSSYPLPAIPLLE